MTETPVPGRFKHKALRKYNLGAEAMEATAVPFEANWITRNEPRGECRLYSAHAQRGEGWFSDADWRHILWLYNFCCAGCGLETNDLCIDHIVPVAIGGNNWPYNLQPLCKRCNSRKGCRLEYRHVADLYAVDPVRLRLMPAYYRIDLMSLLRNALHIPRAHIGGGFTELARYDWFAMPQLTTYAVRDTDRAHVLGKRTTQATKTIVLASQKGGAGKSTIAVQLSLMAEKNGETILVDADPQKSVWEWGALRDAHTPQIFTVSAWEVPQLVDAAKTNGVDYVIVDTASHTDLLLYKTLATADLVVIPVRPTLFDLQALKSTQRMVEAAGRPAVVVLSQMPTNKTETSVAEEVASAIADMGLTVAPIRVRHHAAYSRALLDGLAVTEYPRRAKYAREEIEALWSWIQTRCGIASLVYDVEVKPSALEVSRRSAETAGTKVSHADLTVAIEKGQAEYRAKRASRRKIDAR